VFGEIVTSLSVVFPDLVRLEGNTLEADIADGLPERVNEFPVNEISEPTLNHINRGGGETVKFAEIP